MRKPLQWKLMEEEFVLHEADLDLESAPQLKLLSKEGIKRGREEEEFIFSRELPRV